MPIQPFGPHRASAATTSSRPISAVVFGAFALAAFAVRGLASAGQAASDPGDDEGRSPTWDMTQLELEAVGLGQDRGTPVPTPADAPLENLPGPFRVKQGVIFVNMDGAELSGGYDSSKNDVTSIDECTGFYPAYGTGNKREALMQAVRADWQPFNVVVTDTRPASGDYTMNMTGPKDAFGDSVLGIAPIDCNDNQTHNNITFAFHSADDQFSASTQATTVSQEVAHSYGLEHVDEPGDIMNPRNAGGNPSFTDQCIDIVPSEFGIACEDQHAAQCGSSSSQNSYQELLVLFGPSTPDTADPVVQITYPTDGETFDVGTDFDITVSASDDTQVKEIQLFYNGTYYKKDIDEPYGWGVVNITAGTYEFYVKAIDLAGNEGSSNTVTITVGVAPSSTTSDVGDESSGGGDESSGGGDEGAASASATVAPTTTSVGDPSDSSESDGGYVGTDSEDAGNPAATTAGASEGFPPLTGDQDRSDGCGCRTDATVPVAPLASVVLLCGVSLRRRRAS